MFKYPTVMKIVYYIESDRKENLYCRISDGENRVSFPLGYIIATGEWKELEEGVSIEDPHYTTLMNLKEYLSNRYLELKSLEISTFSVLETLKKEAEHLLTGRV